MSESDQPAGGFGTLAAVSVRRFHVEGYRSLADVTLEFGNVTVILGPNGSGKTNLYRALRLAHECGDGRLARAIVQEGGMPSVVHGGRRRGEPRIELAVDLDDMTYEVCLVTVGRGIGGRSPARSRGTRPSRRNGSSSPALLLHVEGMMRPLSAPELPDGQLRFLFLAAALLSQRPPVMVVLNEPETSLHVRLLAALVGAAAERTQVVLTTHAANLAKALLEREGSVGVELDLRGGATHLVPL